MMSSRKTNRKRPAHERNKAYEYVGRFLWSFANVAAAIEELFSNKFNLDAFSSLLMQQNIDIRKKLALLEFAFERQETEDIKAIKRILDQVHRFHDIRNAIAHSGFNHVPSFTRIENGQKVHFPAGVEFGYVDRSGELRITGLPKMRSKQKNRDWLSDERTITYAEFEDWDTQMSQLAMTLSELDPDPVNEGVNFVRDVAKIIAASDNVLPFSKP
jgi:hypothetical protein